MHIVDESVAVSRLSNLCPFELTVVIIIVCDQIALIVFKQLCGYSYMK